MNDEVVKILPSSKVEAKKKKTWQRNSNNKIFKCEHEVPTKLIALVSLMNLQVNYFQFSREKSKKLKVLFPQMLLKR